MVLDHSEPWVLMALPRQQCLQGQPQKGGVTVGTRGGSQGVGGVWPPPSTPPWRHLHSLLIPTPPRMSSVDLGGGV